MNQRNSTLRTTNSDSRIRGLELDEKEEELFMRTRQVQKSFKMMSRHFLELDFEIHATLEKENSQLMAKYAKGVRKFLKGTKNLSKILKIGWVLLWG